MLFTELTFLPIHDMTKKLTHIYDPEFHSGFSKRYSTKATIFQFLMLYVGLQDLIQIRDSLML